MSKILDSEIDYEARCPTCGLPDQFCDKSHSALREWLTHGSAKNFRVSADVLLELENTEFVC